MSSYDFKINLSFIEKLSINLFELSADISPSSDIYEKNDCLFKERRKGKSLENQTVSASSSLNKFNKL